MAFDLNAYLARIHFSGAPVADLNTLKQLHLLHTCAIPFENLDVLLERRIHLDDDSVFEKLVTAGRGGYCFEHNGLLRRALLEVGYQVEDLAGRVLMAKPKEMPSRTHRILRVTVGQQKWLVDAGFGGKTLTAPLLFELDCEQRTPHGVYRLTFVENEYELSIREDDGWLTLYRFSLTHQYFSDYQAGNHYVATWPESHFRHHLLMSRHQQNGDKLTLLNRQFTRHGEKYDLADALSVYQTLQTQFGLRVDDPRHGISAEEFAAIFARLEL